MQSLQNSVKTRIRPMSASAIHVHIQKLNEIA